MKIEHIFLNDCITGNLHNMQLILSSLGDSTEAYLTVNEGFRWACLHGHLPVVSYLLTSLEIPQRALIHSHNDSAINNAVKNGHIHIIDYLLYSSEITDHINLDKNLLSCIEQAIVNKQRGVLEYFIFELNIPLTNNLMHFVKEKVHTIDDWGITAINLFNTQILYNQLHDRIKNSLPPLSKKINEKIKI